MANSMLQKNVVWKFDYEDKAWIVIAIKNIARYKIARNKIAMVKK